MYLGLDCGTSGLKALLTDERGEPVASAARRLCARPSAPGLVGAKSRRLGGLRWRARSPTSETSRGQGAERGEGDRLLGPDAWRGASSTAPTSPSARRSCTTTGAPFARPTSLRATMPELARNRRRQADAGLHRAEAQMDRPARARTIAALSNRSPVAEGLSAPEARRRTGIRHERRGGDVAARRGRDAPGPDRRSTPATRIPPGRRRLFEGSAPAGKIRLGGCRRAWPAARGSACGRRRRRRGRGGRLGRDRAGRSLHFAWNRDAAHRRDRSLYERAGDSSCILSPTRCRTGGTRWRRCSTAPARSLSPGAFSAPRPTRSSARRRRIIQGPARLLFLPYLSGERTPLDDPYARGVLFGMSETTSRADVARAVMEGVALTLADARDCLSRRRRENRARRPHRRRREECLHGRA